MVQKNTCIVIRGIESVLPLVVSREVEEFEDIKGIGCPASGGKGRGQAYWSRSEGIFATVVLHTALYLCLSLIF